MYTSHIVKTNKAELLRDKGDTSDHWKEYIEEL